MTESLGGIALRQSAEGYSDVVDETALVEPPVDKVIGNSEENSISNVGASHVTTLPSTETQGRSDMGRLIADLDNPVWKVRWDAVNELGNLKDPKAIPALAKVALEDDNPHPRWRSLWALRTVDSDSTETITLLKEGLSSSDALVTRNAAVALAFFGESDGVDELLNALDDSDEFRRWEAVYNLKKIAGPQDFEALVIHLSLEHESSVRVRQEVALALGTMGDSGMVGRLVEALRDDPSPQVRWRAALSIGKLGDSSVVDELEMLLASEMDAQVNEHISDAIAHLQNHDAGN